MAEGQIASVADRLHLGFVDGATLLTRQNLFREQEAHLDGVVRIVVLEHPGPPQQRDVLGLQKADDGVEFFVESGWRSPEYQDQLLREAVAEYGSEEEAARWVATADTSPHVSGDAIDIGHSDATAWLSEHGAEYGLCQIYGNEPWHYELRPEAVDHSCPPMYADPTHDPRTQLETVPMTLP